MLVILKDPFITCNGIVWLLIGQYSFAEILTRLAMAILEQKKGGKKIILET